MPADNPGQIAVYGRAPQMSITQERSSFKLGSCDRPIVSGKIGGFAVLADDHRGPSRRQGAGPEPPGILLR